VTAVRHQSDEGEEGVLTSARYPPDTTGQKPLCD